MEAARAAANTAPVETEMFFDAEKAQMQKVKDIGLEMHEILAGIGSSRELSLAKTKVEEAVMWAVKHITG